MVNAPSGAAAGADATGVGAVCAERRRLGDGASVAFGGASVAFARESRRARAGASRGRDGGGDELLRGDTHAPSREYLGDLLGVCVVVVAGEEGAEARRSGRVGSDARAGFGENPTGAPSGSRPKDAPGGADAGSGSTPVLWKSSHHAYRASSIATAAKEANPPTETTPTCGWTGAGFDRTIQTRTETRSRRGSGPAARRSPRRAARIARRERVRRRKGPRDLKQTRESIVYEVVWMGTSSTARFPGTDVD